MKMFFVHVSKGVKEENFCEMFLLSDDTKTRFIVVIFWYGFLHAVLLHCFFTIYYVCLKFVSSLLV